MCSIGVTNTGIIINSSNKFSQRRGPDATSTVTVNGIQFLHNLLHLTGVKTKQPLFDEDVYVVFNGEIYNYLEFGNFNTDGECIISLYKEYGEEFVKLLDGEFAICLVDFSKDKIILSTDTFACKPLWYQFNSTKFFIGSYNSQLKGAGFNNGQKLYANKTKVFSLTDFKLLSEYDNFTFNLNQHKQNFDDWIKAFSLSISKRTNNTQYGVFLGLSSGYDSGAISCELLKQGKEFKTYTILGPENKDVIRDRLNLIPNHEAINFTKKEYETVYDSINSDCEDFVYDSYSIKKDKASVGLAAICKRANLESRRIYLSGQGADEIISDYGFNGNKIYNHSQFGGLFPDNLEGFFPWRSFYDGTQIKYLNKEEYIAGHYGIETRYRFLDKFLVQEFLWLDAKLKNSNYKSAIREYLIFNNFPFKEEKIGFNTLKNLV